MKTSRFKEILLNSRELSMEAQEKHLDDFFCEWKGNTEQTDDVLVIGIEVGRKG